MNETKKRLILIILGCIALALAIVVWVLNRDSSSDILAVIGVLGGIAIIINSLPNNHSDHPA